MNTIHTQKQSHKLHMVHRGFLTALVVVGILGTLVTLRLSWYSESVVLYNRALTVVASMDESTITSLEGSANDVTNPSYIELKKILTRIRAVNTDARFVYVFGLRGEDIFFYADSEDPSSADYSPPGDAYPEASPQFKNVITRGIPFTEGPKTDRWGTWVSGVAPIKDESGKNIAGLGIDIDARMFYANILFHAAVPALLTLIIFIIGYVGTRTRKKEREILASHVNTSSLLTEYVRIPVARAIAPIQDIASRQNITQDQENSLHAVVGELTTVIESTDGILETLNKGVHTKHFPKKD